MRFIAIAVACLLSACATPAQHTYTDYFDSCMVKAKAAKMPNDLAFTQCTMIAFNACTSAGCKK